MYNFKILVKNKTNDYEFRLNFSSDQNIKALWKNKETKNQVRNQLLKFFYLTEEFEILSIHEENFAIFTFLE